MNARLNHISSEQTADAQPGSTRLVDVKQVRLRTCVPIVAALCLSFVGWAQEQPGFQRPQQPGVIKPKFERSREYDLKHVAIHLKIDWESRSLSGSVTHTLAPLRDD